MTTIEATAQNEQVFDFLFGSSHRVRIRGFMKEQSSSTSSANFAFSSYADAEVGYDLYYPPNGHYRGKHVDAFFALWVDLDTPKIDNEYADLESVGRQKAVFHDRILTFPVAPTYVVDTRNGLQALWAIQPITDKARWVNVLADLSRYFDSDRAANRPAQLLRVPNSVWYKTYTGLDPYPVKCVTFNEARYPVDEIERALMKVRESRGSCEEVDIESRPVAPAKAQVNPSSNEYCQRSPHIQTEDGAEIISLTLDGVISRGSARRRLIEIEIKKRRLRESSSVRCPFHEDSTPSAIQNEDGTIFCHVEGTMYSAAEVLAARTDVPTIEAVAELADALDANVPGIETEHLRLALSRIRANEQVLEDLLREASRVHTRLFRSGGIGLKEAMGYLHMLVLSKFDIDEVFDAEGNPVIFVPSRNMAEKLGIAKGKANSVLRILAILGLVRPMPVRELPERQIQRMKDWKVSHQRRSIPFHIGFPDYSDPEWRALFDDRIQRFSDVPLQHRLLTFDAIDTFGGREISEYVYPEVNAHAHLGGHVRAKEYRELILGAIDEQISKNGYAREVEVVSAFIEASRQHQSRAEQEYRYNIPLLLWTYPELVRRHLNKSEKQYLGVDWNHNDAVIILPTSAGEIGAPDSP